MRDPKEPLDPSVFVQAAISAFGFLLQQEFEVTSVMETGVTFESPAVIVRIWRESPSGEIGFYLSLQAAPEERFYSSDFISLVSPGEQRSFQTTSGEVTKAVLVKLSALLEQNGIDALRGDIFAFKRLRDEQARLSDDFLREGRMRYMRGELQQAWSLRDYPRVVDLLAPIEGELTPSERAKLQYARAHMRS